METRFSLIFNTSQTDAGLNMHEKPDESTLMDHLMNHIRDNIYFKDSEGRFVLINEEGAKRAGCDAPADLIGKTDLDIFTEEHGREALKDEQLIMKTGEPLCGKEERETWADGHETWVSTSKMPLRDEEGNIIGTFGISRDVTDYKKAEMLAAKYAEENRRLCDEMESDFQMAAELQKTFLPRSYPTFPNGIDPAESAARFCHLYHSTGAVGGDFCSIRQLSDHEAGILLCDVMGHGVRAALITALMRAIVEEISLKQKDPALFLQHMNKVLKPIIQHGDMFLFSTACYLILDVSTGTVRYSIAGHPVPILLNAETSLAEWLTDDPSHSGPALAVDEDATYDTIERVLHPNDAIIIYTDGLYEVANATGEEFGQERLLELTNRHRNRMLYDIFPALINEIGQFAPDGKFDDDACLVGCRFSHRTGS